MFQELLRCEPLRRITLQAAFVQELSSLLGGLLFLEKLDISTF